MKRLVYLLVVILILAAAVAVSTGPAILWIAQKELGKIFVGGEVSIGESQISPLRQISLFDIEFVQKGLFSKGLSKDLHDVFNLRQVSDYQVLETLTSKNAALRDS